MLIFFKNEYMFSSATTSTYIVNIFTTDVVVKAFRRKGTPTTTLSGMRDSQICMLHIIYLHDLWAMMNLTVQRYLKALHAGLGHDLRWWTLPVTQAATATLVTQHH